MTDSEAQSHESYDYVHKIDYYVRMENKIIFFAKFFITFQIYSVSNILT